MNPLSIEFISVLGMPPVAFAEFARSLGVAHIGLALTPMTANPYGYPNWSLRDDSGLRSDFKAALGANGISISVGEGVFVRPNFDVRDGAGDLDIFAELGVTRLNTICIDGDRNRCRDQVAAFAEMAAARGMTATLEYMAGTVVGTMADAMALIDETGAGNLSLMLDVMHLFRADDPIDALDPARIGYVQLCDVPRREVDASYGAEALHNRLIPGDGDIPLAEILARIPEEAIIGLEVPMRARAEAGEAPEDYLGVAVDRTRALLSVNGG